MKSPLLQLVAALTLSVVALIGYAAWYAAIADTSNAVANIESQIEAKTQAQSRIASTRAALAEIAGDETAMRGYFVSETGVVAFIDDLEARGRTHGAVVSVLSVSTTNAGGHPAFALGVSVKGVFDAVMRTLGVIEYAPRDLSVSTLSLTQVAKNSWRADLNLVVSSVSASSTALVP